MKTVSSYKVKIINTNKSLDKTINIYRDALSYVIDVVNNNWTSVCGLTKKEKYNFVESLIHNTKTNLALYDFDDKFYKLPSYLRRSLTSDAIGIVSSYYSNLENYNIQRQVAISNGKKFQKKPPKLQIKHYKCPALYKGNMFEMLGNNKAKIKIYNGSDWVWLVVSLRSQDLKYISKCSGDISSPVLEKSGRAYSLRFSFEDKATLKNTKLKEQRIVAIDLGLNHSAVCSLMSYDGTVTKRLFINQPVEKDQQAHLINKLKLKQITGGKYAKNPKLWAKINNLNKEIVSKTIIEIVKFAKDNNADKIVVEYLDFAGKKTKRIAQRVHLWAVKDIQNKLIYKAHKEGIRVNRVSARNTSILAFDGSGKVSRDTSNASICTFATGKIYNTDLNASYNIGARYYIGQIQKTISEKKWSEAMAKVPELQRRTQCTLSSLINLVAVI